MGAAQFGCAALFYAAKGGGSGEGGQAQSVRYVEAAKPPERGLSASPKACRVRRIASERERARKRRRSRILRRRSGTRGAPAA